MDSQPNDTVNSDGEEVIFESREDLIKGYNQIISALLASLKFIEN